MSGFGGFRGQHSAASARDLKRSRVYDIDPYRAVRSALITEVITTAPQDRLERLGLVWTVSGRVAEGSISELRNNTAWISAMSVATLALSRESG